MTLSHTITLADSRAQQHLAENLKALDRTQPQLRPWVGDEMLNVEWVFARDKTLTALEEGGRWWSGCSLPRRAAEALLAKLEIKGAGGCFLAPAHAAQLRVALNAMRAEQAVIAIVPEMRDLALMLHCDNFSAEIAANRLWFAAGPAWNVGLRRLFDDRVGLATPSQFIRTAAADTELADSMIAAAQKVFSNVGTARALALQAMRHQPGPTPAVRRRLCVVAPSRFRLWNDIGHELLRIFEGQSDIEPVAFDADDPACSSPMALVQAAGSCDAILTANTSRTDLPGLLPETMPWLTWVTGDRVPSATLAGIDDHLIVADESVRQAAIRAGWAERRVHIGTWPALPVFAPPQQSGQRNGTPLAIIAGTVSLDTPKDLVEYSSHGLLWEAIREELIRNPFVLTDAAAYLEDRMRRHSIGQEAFPHTRFIDKLILPAYQQGLARTLVRAKVAVRLWGRGWDALAEFQPHAAGAVTTREQFRQIVADSTALIDLWPGVVGHPVHSTGARIIRPGRSADWFVREARSALSGRSATPAWSAPTIGADLIKTVLRSER